MTDLHTLLELSTDGIDSPDLARTALTTARRRRTRHRGAVAGLAAGVAVAGIVLVPRAVDTSAPAREPTGSPTPTPSPSPSPSPAPTGDDGLAVAPPISDAAIQPVWDPAGVAGLPFGPMGHVPNVLSPTRGTGSRPGDTTGVLALSRFRDDQLAVFYGERGWYAMRRVPGAGDIWDSALSRDGTRMAVAGEGGLLWCAAAEECPDWHRVAVPKALGQGVRLTWTHDSDRLLVSDFVTGYLVELDSGEVTELPYLGDAALDAAPDGRIVSRQLDARTVAEWDGAEQVTPSVATGDLGGLNDIVVSQDAIAATRVDLSYGDPRAAGDGDGLVVLERGTLRTRAFLPFAGSSGQWVDSNQVRPVQWLDGRTLLVSVLVDDIVHLVEWDTATGDLARVTRYPVAEDLSLRDLSHA
jgi:hypothetical protein